MAVTTPAGMAARTAMLASWFLVLPARALLIKSNATQGQAPQELQAWFPLVNHTAVVRPFWLGELLPMAQVEHSPDSNCERHACPSGSDYRLPIDLVLYYAGKPEDHVLASVTAQSVLEKMALRIAGKGCYRGVRVAYGNMAREVRWPEGPCRQFMSMVGTQPAAFWGYRAVFQMELDVLPVRDGWLLGLLPHLARAANGESWVIGGHYTESCMVNRETGEVLRQQLSEGMADHINGNAVYSADPTFTRWVYAHAVNCPVNGHYDAWMYTFAERQKVTHMWVAAPEIINCKPNAIARKSFMTLGAHEIAQRFPSAAVAHSTVEPTGSCP